MPRCNNMSLRRTKCKVPIELSVLCGTLMQISHKFFNKARSVSHLFIDSKRKSVRDEVNANPQFADLLALAHALADRSGSVILPHFRTRLGINHKGGAVFDPVTEADRAAELVIRDALAKAHPTHGIVGEE